jgi:hypothetical protein
MGRKSHFTGSIVMGDEEGQELEFESHTELQTALVMLARPEVISLENQIRFVGIDPNDVATEHVFDFRVSLRDGTRTALVVKHAVEAADPDFRAKMRCLAKQVVPDVADRVCLITERDLDPIEVFNAELIHSVRQPDPEPDAAVRRIVASLTGAAKIADIAAASGCSGNGFRAVVRMLRHHELELVSRERIAPESLVRRRVA